MAITADRFTWSDDSGTPAAPVGDGTTINNAELQKIFDRIDNMFSGSDLSGSGGSNYSTFLVGGLLASEGFGNHTISAGGTGGNNLVVRNTTAGTANYAALHLGNDSSATRVRLLSLTTTFSSAAEFYADGCTLVSNGAGGLQLSATNAAGVIRLYTGSTPTEHVKLNATGKLLLRHGSATYDENYGPLTITGPGTNFGQQLSLIRSGAAAWSMGFAYNTSTFAIGTGQSTDSNFTAAAAALTITTAGEVQAPLQPGFLAANSGDQTVGNATATVTFGTEVYDVGGDFASNTFTAPVAGYYLFTAVVTATWTGTRPTLLLVAGGSSYMLAEGSASTGTSYESLTGSVVVYLTAAQTALVQITMRTAGDLVNGTLTPYESHFSGRLLA